MTFSEQDNKILSALIEQDKQTSYSLSQITGISVPQINFRLSKLVLDKVVYEIKENEKTIYTVHGSLKSKATVNKIADRIKEIADVVDKEEYATPEGMRSILCFILSKITFEDPKELLEQQEVINAFVKDLEKYAKEHNLVLVETKGWSKNKIKWCALNDRKCPCAPKDRYCPCSQGLIEIKTRGVCKCGLLGDKSWQQKTAKKMKF